MSVKPWTHQQTLHLHTGGLLCCPLSSCLNRTDMFFQFWSKIAWGPLHSSHQRSREWDTVSQLITERQSALLVSPSYTLESSHPKQHLPLVLCKVYSHLKFIFIQGEALLGLAHFYTATEVSQSWWLRRVYVLWSRAFDRSCLR